MNHDVLIACVGGSVFAIALIAAIESFRSRFGDDQ
jgi:hypothetical protein